MDDAAFTGFDFTSLDFGPGVVLTGFSLSTALAGLTAALISFTDHSIRFSAEGLGFADAPYTIRLDLITNILPCQPSTLALLGLELPGALVACRRPPVALLRRCAGRARRGGRRPGD